MIFLSQALSPPSYRPDSFIHGVLRSARHWIFSCKSNKIAFVHPWVCINNCGQLTKLFYLHSAINPLWRPKLVSGSPRALSFPIYSLEMTQLQLDSWPIWSQVQCPPNLTCLQGDTGDYTPENKHWPLGIHHFLVNLTISEVSATAHWNRVLTKTGWWRRIWVSMERCLWYTVDLKNRLQHITCNRISSSHTIQKEKKLRGHLHSVLTIVERIHFVILLFCLYFLNTQNTLFHWSFRKIESGGSGHRCTKTLLSTRVMLAWSSLLNEEKWTHRRSLASTQARRMRPGCPMWQPPPRFQESLHSSSKIDWDQGWAPASQVRETTITFVTSPNTGRALTRLLI